jgi:hypothetical protein
MLMDTPQDKGDSLENAVAAIEEVILHSSAGMGRKPIVEKKKIIIVNEVRHEIDVHVTADLAPGYKPVFIFECKNWKEAVGKNEIIIFSEKIDVSRATSGCFVAKSFTSDAVNQAKQDPRITLLLAAEHDPDSGTEVFRFFTRTPEMTKLDVTMLKPGSKGLDGVPISIETAKLECFGKSVDFRTQLHIWSQMVCEDDLRASFEEPVPAGIYHRVVDRDLPFVPGQVFVNDQEVEELSFHVEYKITVSLVPVISHFEVKSRGRCITFAPQLIGNDTMQWQVVMPTAK